MMSKRQKLAINKIEVDNQLVDEPSLVENARIDYFLQLFPSEATVRYESLIQCIPLVISQLFSTSWDILKGDILQGVQQFREGTPLLKVFSSTLITLIPKKENLATFNDYWPISLCTFFSKICTKILANRLPSILPSIITQEQVSFVKGRSISNNVLLTQEIVESIDRKTRKESTIIKLDLTKVFDYVCWGFLYWVLHAFGF
ncbi:hypothetical protein ACH5RR_001395 [Cinchona calisaya]|uniref:Reverse transcriptase domain-containing protein n=1 Tax=Cinchona calisaya TaxID=153742 RepID=A0ABD3B3K7_9GENT